MSQRDSVPDSAPPEDAKPAPPATPARITRALLLAGGIVFGMAALLYNEWVIGLLASGDLPAIVHRGIRSSEAAFALLAAVLLLLSELVRRAPRRIGLAGRPTTPVVLLAALGLLGPLLLLDLGLRPFVEPKTTLFERDPDLGWRPRPGVTAEWGHVLVRINAKGLRGPEVAWEKPTGVFRVLYLGDSVTFGFRIERVEDTYPYVVGEDLERRMGSPVETVNSGVGGWSPWQEYAYLLRDGLRYHPDLIVVGFVLNDVTEKFSLSRFGGVGEGWHLSRTARSRLDAWLSHSAIASFLREGIAQFRFGGDVFLGAQRYEAKEVQWLAANARSAPLRTAWAITFRNLAGIFQAAAERGIPAALVVFPYSFQVADPAGTGAPQEMLREFAEARGIPHLDLLPVFAASAPGDGLFLDTCHLTPKGSRVAGDAIAEFLIERGLARSP